jgi:hypothetical protein
MTDEKKKKIEYKDLSDKAKKLSDMIINIGENHWLEAKNEIRKAIDELKITKKEIELVPKWIEGGNDFVEDILIHDLLYDDDPTNNDYSLASQPEDWVVGTERPNSLEEDKE